MLIMQVIEEILAEAGKALYETYLAKKAFSFAAEATSKALVGQLRMCFVPFDEGERAPSTGGGRPGQPTPTQPTLPTLLETGPEPDFGGSVPMEDP